MQIGMEKAAIELPFYSRADGVSLNAIRKSMSCYFHRNALES